MLTMIVFITLIQLVLSQSQQLQTPLSSSQSITQGQQQQQQQQQQQSMITDNNCTVNKFRIPVSARHIRTIFQYSCPLSSWRESTEPILPSIGNAQPYEFNEMDLSQNVFSSIPFEQLCTFKYIYMLNMSSNLIQNLTGGFINLKCLASLTNLDLSKNLISTALLPTDFDDVFASRLQIFNLENNKISNIQTSVFIKKDGTSRFPNLYYLNLAKNLIKKFDLLWPLTLPSPNLFIDLKMNPIGELVNQMGQSFKNPSYIYDMIGNRYVDVTTNRLQFLDDSNLMQYGLQDSRDFRQFLNKISNYDFRQANYVRTFICYCPSGGLYTVEWFKNISFSLDLNCPIFQLFCSNFQTPIYIFNFPCESSLPSLIPTSSKTSLDSLVIERAEKITTASTAFTETTHKTFPVNAPFKSVNRSELFRAFNLNRISSNVSSSSSNTIADNNSNVSDFNYAYLVLLIIPFMLVMILLFVCACGRRFQVFIHNNFSIIMLPCFRPPDQASKSSKIYDITICFSEYDEQWFNEEFMSKFSEYDPGFKTHSLILYQRLNYHLSETSKRVLNSSKRIVLIFSEKFLNNEWNNKTFRDYIKNIAFADKSCIIVPINQDGLSEYRMNLILDELNAKINDTHKRLLPIHYKKEPPTSKLVAHMKHTFGLDHVEYLNWKENDFWKNFNYVMPCFKQNQITNINKSTKHLMPKYYNQELKSNSSSSNSSSAGKVSSIRSLSKKRNRRINEAKMIDFNIEPVLPELTDTDVSFSMNNNKNTSSVLKQVIVPIPSEMRTQLGSKIKSKTFDLEPVKLKNPTENELDKSKIFLTSQSKSIQPFSGFTSQEKLFTKPFLSNSSVLDVNEPNEQQTKRTRLQSELTSNDLNMSFHCTNKIRTTEKISTVTNFAPRKKLQLNRKTSRRRRLSRSDTNSLSGGELK